MKLKNNLLLLSFALTFSSIYAQETHRLETKAREWITNSNASKANFNPNTKYKLDNSRSSATGETLRFEQTINGVPIFEGDIVVHFNNEDNVTYTADAPVSKKMISIDTNPKVSLSSAFDIAKEAIQPKGDIIFEDNKLYVYNTEDGEARLVYRVVIDSYEKAGSWETIVDAHTKEVISIKDIAVYRHKKHDEKPKKVTVKNNSLKATGTAYIYNPDPLSVAGVKYGGQYVDNNDATNASLDAARSLVNLPEIELLNGVYKLKSKYAEIKELQSPATGLFTQSSPDFLFNRSQLGFEAANIFFHFHQSMAYINETLGIACKPTVNGGAVQFDPHGQNGAENSAFFPGGQYLTFGQGGVDDGEDADVILHELGHGIHHWITGLKSSSKQGLGEGSGDYWAMSYKRSLKQWPSSAPEYNWVFNWDGHNPFWSGRITNYSAKYPTSNINNDNYIHINGQIWATALMRIYDKIGKEKTDRIFLEGLALTNSSANQQTAAEAVRQAAIDMNGKFGFSCEDVKIINQEMITAGYTMANYICKDLAVNDIKKDQIKIYPNPTKDILNITLDANKDSKATVTSLDGRQVLTTTIKNGKNQINVSNLPKGVYLLTAEGISQKFIKE
ncbi:T9SS type A sorting domain-containing protein [Chryseobacterium sp. T1]